MNKRVPIYHTTSKVHFSWLAGLTHLPLERTVHNEPVKPVVHFILAASEENLFFGGYWDKVFAKEPEDKKGDFVEGLWESEVLEVFLANSSGTDYVEFNINPSGQWWGAHFSDYRKRQGLLNPDRGEVFREGQAVYLKYPLKNLSIQALKNSRANVTAVHFVGDQRVEYQSWNWAKQEKPDFHDRKLLARFEVDVWETQ